MAITIEGVRINNSIEALQPGQGFLVKVNSSWNASNQDNELRNAIREAQENDIIGSLYNGHDDTYALAEATASAVINQFETDIVNFVQGWNANSGSQA